jgi:DNA polymerase-3 subunit epsilon
MGEFVALDFETANSKRASVCAMGIAVVSGTRVVDTVSWLVRPRELYFDPFNTWIHGITEEDVENEPEFDELWDELRSYLTNRIVLAHSASFDFSVLRQVLDLYEIAYPRLSYFCSRVIAKRMWPGLLNYGLDTVSNHLGFTFEHHDPQEDAVASAKVAIAALTKAQVSTLKELAAKTDLLMGELYPGGYRPCRLRPQHLRPESLVPSTSEFRVEHPFFDKLVVFTGTLQSMLRGEAMQCVIDLGARCANSVTKATNFLVVGDQDFAKLRGASKSSKLRKAESLIQNGRDLEIVRESEFLRMLDL